MACVHSSAQDWFTNLKNDLGGEEMQSLLDKFSGCSTEPEQVSLLYECEGVNRVVQVKTKKKLKSAEDCIKLREAGNKAFQEKKFIKALEFYNKSVVQAPVSGDQPLLALALANRSAALLYLKQYRLCLADIQAAYAFGYPEDLRYKLQEREGKCYFQLKEKDKARDFLEQALAGLEKSSLPNDKKSHSAKSLQKQIKQCETMSEEKRNVPSNLREDGHGPIPEVKSVNNKLIPGLTDQATVMYSETTGRGLVADQDIMVGDVVVVEKPYSSTLLPEFAPTHCNYCCRRILAPSPCLECSAVVYCDDTCRKKDWEGYHKYECEILESVRDADISLGHLALRMVLHSGFRYLEEFEEKVKLNKDDPKTVGFNEQGVYDSNDYRTVYSLMNHTADRKTEDVLRYCLSAVFLLKCLEQTSFFHDDVVPLSKKALVGGHILRHLQMLPCNAHEVSELAVKYSNLPASVTTEIGSAIYPVLSLINHSCDPNVVRHSYGDACVVRAIRNIPKGSEILDNYGTLYALTACEERRKKLEPQYFFICNCLACTDDYLQYLDLPTDVPVFKCDQCWGPVFLPFKGSSESVPCSVCKFCHDLTIRTGTLAKSDESFRSAMMEVLTNEHVDVRLQIPVLVDHLQLMDQLVLRPWRDYNDCQEVLKQCYALLASHYQVQD